MEDLLAVDVTANLGPAVEPLVRLALESRGSVGGPITLGLCGSQGAGKTTLTAAAARLLAGQGLRVAILSLDDLYLTRAERAALAAEVHPLFATRGPPGTHDVALGEAVLDALKAPGSTLLPRFDKAQDTRRPIHQWDTFEGPADVILFEGWCVGARPQSVADLARPVNDLDRQEDPEGIWRTHVNAALAGPYQRLFDRLDVLALLAAPGFEAVYDWRCEQEAELRRRAAPDAPGLMDRAQLRRFVSHYERLTRHILAEMPGRADLTIHLDSKRLVRSVDERRRKG